jgi:TRAP-type transport system large permease protein
MAVLIFLGCLLGGIAIGLPIAWALLLCGAALMFWLGMFDVQIMAQTLVNGADSFSLLAIPFFVLAGEIMNAGGLLKRIVDLPMKLVGHKPGGLGYVGVLAAMIMASLSGSAVADTAAVAARQYDASRGRRPASSYRTTRSEFHHRSVAPSRGLFPPSRAVRRR